MTYDRAAIMRESWRLRRKGLDASTALRFAWAKAKKAERESLENPILAKWQEPWNECRRS